MEALIEQCTSEKNTQDKWDLILRVCEEYGSKEPKGCLKAIGKRLFHKNPNVCLRAVTLLDACSKNCGKAFNRELASRDFSQLVKSRFASLQRIPSIKLVEVFEKWAEEFKSDSELALAASLYSWVKSEHYEVIKHLHEDRQALKSDHVRQNAAKLQAKEEEELAKAIALSLKESENKASAGYGSSRPGPTATGASSSATNTAQASASNRQLLYPNFSNGPAPSVAPAKGRVRALYDFEAAEDNELTFKAGELIVLLDDSDENWWRGSNHRGEGLFPAQFVKRETEDRVTGPTNTASAPEDSAAVQASTSVQPKAPVQLDGTKLDECLRLISLVDPTGEFRPDPPELAQLEAECNAMAPLVDPELEKVDKRVLMLSDLNQRLLDAFQMYHDLMSRPVMPAAPSSSSYYGQAYMGSYVSQPGPGVQYATAGQDGVQPYNPAHMNPSSTMHGYAAQEAIYAVPGQPGPMSYGSMSGAVTATNGTAIPTNSAPSGATVAHPPAPPTGMTHSGFGQSLYYPMASDPNLTTHSMPSGYAVPDPYTGRYTAVPPNASTVGSAPGCEPDGGRQPPGLPSYSTATQPMTAPNAYYYGYTQTTDRPVPDSGHHPGSGVMVHQPTNPIG